MWNSRFWHLLTAPAQVLGTDLSQGEGAHFHFAGWQDFSARRFSTAIYFRSLSSCDSVGMAVLSRQIYLWAVVCFSRNITFCAQFWFFFLLEVRVGCDTFFLSRQRFLVICAGERRSVGVIEICINSLAWQLLCFGLEPLPLFEAALENAASTAFAVRWGVTSAAVAYGLRRFQFLAKNCGGYEFRLFRSRTTRAIAPFLIVITLIKPVGSSSVETLQGTVFETNVRQKWRCKTTDVLRFGFSFFSAVQNCGGPLQAGQHANSTSWGPANQKHFGILLWLSPGRGAVFLLSRLSC